MVRARSVPIIPRCTHARAPLHSRRARLPISGATLWAELLLPQRHGAESDSGSYVPCADQSEGHLVHRRLRLLLAQPLWLGSCVLDRLLRVPWAACALLLLRVHLGRGCEGGCSRERGCIKTSRPPPPLLGLIVRVAERRKRSGEWSGYPASTAALSGVWKRSGSKGVCNVSARRTAKSRSQRVAANVCFTVLVRTRRGSSARGGVGHALKLLCGVGALDLAV